IDEELFFIEDAAAISPRELAHSDLEAELKIRCPECGIQKRAKPFSSENVQRSFPSIEMKSTDQARDTVEVISVQMPDENRMDAAAFHARSHELQLRAFATIEQKNVAFADQRRRGQASSKRGDSRTRSEKDYFHGSL